MTTTEPLPMPEAAPEPTPVDAAAAAAAPMPETTPPPTPVDHPATSVVVGAATAAWNRLAPSRDRIGLREVAVGAVFEIEDAAAAALARLRQARSRPRQRPAMRLLLLLEQAQQGVVRLAQRGVLEEERGRQRAAQQVDSLVASVSTAGVVERAIDTQVDRLLRPLVGRILDDVLTQLQNEPDRIQTLVRGQRDSMVNELVGRLRQSAAAGDTAVDRVAARLIRRSSTTRRTTETVTMPAEAPVPTPADAPPAM